MSKEELIPCPFCGDSRKHEIVEQLLDSFLDPIYFVECSRCGCQGPCAETPEKALIEWDTRSPKKEGGE